MKTVWVNRHHADGSVKPMSEWVCKEVNSKITHSEAVEGNRSKFFIFSANEAKKSGLSNLEYIGDQRGDGWFYVADGDLPLLNELVYTYDGSRLKVDCMARIGISSEPWFADDPDEIVKCWQPIQPPKYLD